MAKWLWLQAVALLVQYNDVLATRRHEPDYTSARARVLMKVVNQVGI